MYTLLKTVIPKLLYLIDEFPDPQYLKCQTILTTIICVNNGLVHYEAMQANFFERCQVIAQRFNEVAEHLPDFKYTEIKLFKTSQTE